MLRLGATFALLSCMPPSALGQSGSCLTDPQGEEGIVLEVRRIYATADSATLVSSGHPFASGSSVALATSSPTCDAAVAAYNRDTGLAGTPQAVTQLYVLLLGSSGFVVINPAEQAAGRAVFRVYLSDWQLKQTLQG